MSAEQAPRHPSSAARSNALYLPLVAASSFLAMLVVARILPVADFALYVLALAVRASVQYLADLGVGAASSRSFAALDAGRAGRQARRLYWRLLGVRAGIVISLATLVLIFPGDVSRLLSLGADRDAFLVFVVGIGATEIAGTLGWYVLTALYAHREANRVSLAASVAQPALVIVAAIAGLGLVGILAALIAVSAGRSLALNFHALHALRGMPDDGLPIDDLGRQMTGVAGASIITKAGSWIHSRPFLTLVAAGTRSRLELAVFALGHDLCQQSTSLAAAPASGILLPAFARAETDRARTEAVYQTTARLAGLAAFPLAAALFVTASDLIPLLFGAQYADAADYVRLLSFALALELMLVLPSNALALANAAVLRPYVAVRIVVLVLGGAYVLLDDVGLLWMAAWMIGVRLAAVAVLHVIIARRTGIRLEYGWIARLVAATGAATIAGAATAAVISARPASAFAAGAVVLATFAVALRVVGLLRPDDLALLRRIVPVRTPAALPSSDPR